MDEDLYGDLDTSTSALAKTEVLQQKQRVESENEKLRKELAVLQHENWLLGERNRTLETNMSTLFVTAQHELKRKDAEIQRLREALEHSDKSERKPAPGGRSRERARDSSRESVRESGRGTIERSDRDYTARRPESR